jgi:sirohydrochlorin ferrochelatase
MKSTKSKNALLIVDHGSTRKEANDMLKLVAARCKRLKKGMAVHYAHMELAEPTIAQGFEKCVNDGAKNVTVLPYMLSPGRHATSDIPNMVAECAARHPGVKFKVTKPLGLSNKIAEVVLERAGIK